jgi:flagellar biosynthetic protein FliR
MTENWEPWLLRFGLILIRVSLCVVAMPLLGRISTVSVRAFFIGALALMLTFVLPATEVRPLGHIVPFAFAALGEAVLGLAIGFCARLIMVAGEFAGQVIGVPMGVGFMQVVDPLTGNQLVITSRVYTAMTVLVFIVIGGHHAIIYGLAASFQAWPAGQGLPGREVGWFVGHLSALMLRSGVSLAAPVLVSILAVKIGLGIISRSAPRVQVFFIGFALAIMVGVLVLMTTTPEMVRHISMLTLSLSDWLPQLFDAARRVP